MRRRDLLIGLGAALASSPVLAQVHLSGGEAGGPVSLGVVSWRDIPFRTVVRQQHDYSCGSAALATLLTYHYQRPTTEAQVFTAMYAAGDQAQIRRLGFSMLDMKGYLEARRLRADGFRVSLAQIERTGLPVIALIRLGRYNHFVVVKGVSGGHVLVGDPAAGLRVYPAADFESVWNGIAFAVSGASARPVFNEASEWSPRAVPGREFASRSLPASALLNELAPLYQISGVLPAPATGQ